MGTQGLHSRTNLHVAAVWNAKLYEIIAFQYDVNNRGVCPVGSGDDSDKVCDSWVVLSNTDPSDILFDCGVEFVEAAQSFHYHCMIALHSLCVFVFLSQPTPIYVTVPHTKLMAWSQLHAKWVLFCKALCSKGLQSDKVQEQWSRFGLSRISEVWGFSHSGTCQYAHPAFHVCMTV